MEGERKADAAAKLLGSCYVVVSLSGGAKAIGKVDLSPLVARDVVAWPDHDRDGVDVMAKAGRAIESLQIKQHGAIVRSLRIVKPIPRGRSSRTSAI